MFVIFGSMNCNIFYRKPDIILVKRIICRDIFTLQSFLIIRIK